METAEAVALSVTGPDYTDYLMTAFGDQPHTVTAPSGEAFTFTDYGYLRAAQGQVVARGKLTALRLNARPWGERPRPLSTGDRNLAPERGICQLGSLPSADPVAPASVVKEEAERAASLHYYCLPKEVHLSAEKAADARRGGVALAGGGAG